MPARNHLSDGPGLPLVIASALQAYLVRAWGLEYRVGSTLRAADSPCATMPDVPTSEVGERLVHSINASGGARLTLVGAFEGGETRSAHLLRDQNGQEWVLKWSPATPDSETNLARLVRLVDSLRVEGYPAPGHASVGVVDGLAYWVQERLPGTPAHSEPDRPVSGDGLSALVPHLLDLIELHADRGDLPEPPWPGWLLETLEVGGQGYCLHSTMEASPDTAGMLVRIREIGRRCRDLPARRADIVHFDYSYANVLTDQGRLSGVIDWNVPFPGALQGDRGFDIATLLFYAYDQPSVRSELWDALLRVSSTPWAAAFLAHLVLRQVEWVRRLYPGQPQEARFLAIGASVLDDVDGLHS